MQSVSFFTLLVVCGFSLLLTPEWLVDFITRLGLLFLPFLASFLSPLYLFQNFKRKSVVMF
eukprot:m.20857 g.20857  ORF g.20857 m.20857 type:complete len:61 (-) comp7934_c0_seq1:105-287(-)